MNIFKNIKRYGIKRDKTYRIVTVANDKDSLNFVRRGERLTFKKELIDGKKSINCFYNNRSIGHIAQSEEEIQCGTWMMVDVYDRMPEEFIGTVNRFGKAMDKRKTLVVEL